MTAPNIDKSRMMRTALYAIGIDPHHLADNGGNIDKVLQDILNDPDVLIQGPRYKDEHANWSSHLTEDGYIYYYIQYGLIEPDDGYSRAIQLICLHKWHPDTISEIKNTPYIPVEWYRRSNYKAAPYTGVGAWEKNQQYGTALNKN